MGFVQRMITKMADKMAAAYQLAILDTLPKFFITCLLPNFIYGLLPSNSGLDIGFVRRTITKIADKMATAYQFAFVDTLL